MKKDQVNKITEELRALAKEFNLKAIKQLLTTKDAGDAMYQQFYGTAMAATNQADRLASIGFCDYKKFTIQRKGMCLQDSSKTCDGTCPAFVYYWEVNGDE